MLYTVYETHYMGEEMPETWWRPRRVIGELEFGEDRPTRHTYKIVDVVGPGHEPLLGRIEFARVTERKNGRLIIDGFQRPAHIKDLAWRVRSYPQQWLCIPVKKSPPAEASGA